MVLVLVGCNSNPPSPRAETEQSAPKLEAPARKPDPAQAGRTQQYGSAISPGKQAELAALLRSPREYQGKTVTVEGQVRRVCKKMGCWMELATASDDAAPGCRVFFGAHQFFIPKDSDGARARVQGEVQLKQVQADFVQHLEEEGASFKQKNPDGTADEVRLVASGVELTRS